MEREINYNYNERVFSKIRQCNTLKLTQVSKVCFTDSEGTGRRGGGRPLSKVNRSSKDHTFSTDP